MRAKDFAAELISEIAEDLGFLVYKYECYSPTNGRIVFEKSLEPLNEGESQSNYYKIISYSGHTVTLMAPLYKQDVDLHKSESVEIIRTYFDDSEHRFDSPFAMDYDFASLPHLGTSSTNIPWITTPTTGTTSIFPYTITNTEPTFPLANKIWYVSNSDDSVNPDLTSITRGLDGTVIKRDYSYNCFAYKSDMSAMNITHGLD